MKCPKCGSESLRVVRTYHAGDHGLVQERRCSACRCRMVHEVVLVVIDPPFGQGADALAKRRAAERREVSEAA